MKYYLVKVALLGSFDMAGLLVGSLTFGYLGDRIGRKLTLITALSTGCIGNLVGSFFNNYIAYVLSRFLTGVGNIYI